MLPKRRRSSLSLAIRIAGLIVVFSMASYIYLEPAYHLESSTIELMQHRKGDHIGLMLHEEGQWVHQYNNTENQIMFNTSELRKSYIPEELDRMLGKEMPESYWGEKGGGERSDGMKYKSFLGNQYGACRIKAFRPSISNWVSKYQHQHSDSTKKILSPSLRLMLRLAETNNTLCFAGDSVDFQIYDSLIHNLQRQRTLQNMINISLSTDKRYTVPVNYTNDTGFPEFTGWMTMSNIQERSVSLSYMSDDNTTMQIYSTTIRYFQMYGWSPWNTLMF